MNPNWHRVTVLDAKARLGDCTVCGPGVGLRRRERRGAVEWSCMTRHREYYFHGPEHRRNLGPQCERCGFVPVHRAQLDVHHRDGNHSNNASANLATLCANCHRLEHVIVVAPESEAA
jgi:5-methylcytosine-specific restriction endonuclease McrA